VSGSITTGFPGLVPLIASTTVGSATGYTGTVTPPAFFWNLGDVAPDSSESIDVYMFLPESVPTGTLLTNVAWTTTTASVERGPFDNNVVTHTMIVTEQRLFLDVDKDLLYPGVLVGPGGPLAPVDAMRRHLPHDITNALAASALVMWLRWRIASMGGTP